MWLLKADNVRSIDNREEMYWVDNKYFLEKPKDESGKRHKKSTSGPGSEYEDEEELQNCGIAVRAVAVITHTPLK